MSAGADGKKRVHGNVLELLQGGVGLEGVRDVLCRLSIKPVIGQTASESQKETSGGADSREKRALGMAAYLSDLVAVFDSIKLAMMVAESTVRPFCERLMASTGSVPLSFMISRG